MQRLYRWGYWCYLDGSTASREIITRLWITPFLRRPNNDNDSNTRQIPRSEQQASAEWTLNNNDLNFANSHVDRVETPPSKTEVTSFTARRDPVKNGCTNRYRVVKKKKPNGSPRPRLVFFIYLHRSSPGVYVSAKGGYWLRVTVHLWNTN
jgi:hypothetical protein